MIILKKYQESSLEILRQYLELARFKGAKQAYDETQYNRYGSTNFKPFQPLKGLEEVPYICLRLPTGGGKTLLSAHTIRLAGESYVENDYPLTLWLVPTNIIKQQTLETLKNPDNANRRVLEDTFNGRFRVFDIADFRQISVSDYKNWEQKHEMAPQNRDELFEIMVNRLDDIEHDILHHDFTDRETLAKITAETEIQPLLAKKINDNAKGLYQVVREDEVADKKETDIRLLSNNAGRSVIEIKIGDNRYSVKDLEKAIKDQLVGQYLRHQDCTAGVLLVTYAGGKKFQHPETKGNMPFDDVIQHLKRFAQEIENDEQGRIRLGVMGLDLRNPLTKKAA